MTLEFTLSIPDEHEPGYMGFIDDAIELSGLSDSGQMSVDDWRRLKGFLYGVMATPEDEGEKRAVMRSMSLDDFRDTFSQLFEALNEKKSTAKKNGKST